MDSTLSFPLSTPPPGRGLNPSELVARYKALLVGRDLAWATGYQGLRPLGSGGQGVVLLAERRGADGFAFPAALKVFSPESYRSAAAYEEDMARVASVAAKAAAVQHENLVTVYDFVALDGVRVMAMEYVDGYDLKHVLSPAMLARTRDQLDPGRLRYVEDVVFAPGPEQPLLKPGVAIRVLRDCLGALSALHRDDVAHGDLKPSNIMLKRTGTAKVVDIGSAVDLRLAGGRRMWSPLYAAPEVLEGGPVTPGADLASLGYVLVEMLAGRPPFDAADGFGPLLDAKRTLADRLPDLLPDDVARNDLLVGLCRRLVAADPAMRFPSADSVDLGKKGAAAFHRQLVMGNLASEYEHDLREWLAALS
jgi:serine/threonine protein kinase